MKRPKIGLALGSGAARGLAHLGVLKALEEDNVPIDVISGTSMGAVVGGLYASGLTVGRMADFAREFGGKTIAYWMDPTFFRKGGLLKGDRIEQALGELVGPLSFKDLKVPFYAVASDLSTGNEVIFSEGELVRAIRASFAVPGIFAPVKYRDSWLVDGALTDPIPTKILRDVKCGFIIAVNVCTLPGKEDIVSEDNPSIADVMMQVLSITQQKLSEPCMKLADINIIPDVGNYNWTSFAKTDELIDVGYRAAKMAMPAIKRRLSWSRFLPFASHIFRNR